jgi:hypothetical protein
LAVLPKKCARREWELQLLAQYCLESNWCRTLLFLSALVDTDRHTSGPPKVTKSCMRPFPIEMHEVSKPVSKIEKLSGTELIVAPTTCQNRVRGTLPSPVLTSEIDDASVVPKHCAKPWEARNQRVGLVAPRRPGNKPSACASQAMDPLLRTRPRPGRPPLGWVSLQSALRMSARRER